MTYFIYNGKKSSDYGVIHFTPLPQRAAETIENIDLLGRSENYVRHTERYENIELGFELGIKDRSKLREIYMWLTGTEELILSERPDEVYHVKNILTSSERVALRFGKIAVTFVCSPFAYFKEPTTTIITDYSTYTWIPNNGNTACEPLIRLKLTGEMGKININGEIITIQRPDGYADNCDIILDCAEEIAYFQGPESGIFSCMQYVYGDLPLFHTGDNYVFPEGMKDVVINSRERWI